VIDIGHQGTPRLMEVEDIETWRIARS